MKKTMAAQFDELIWQLESIDEGVDGNSGWPAFRFIFQDGSKATACFARRVIHQVVDEEIEP